MGFIWEFKDLRLDPPAPPPGLQYTQVLGGLTVKTPISRPTEHILYDVSSVDYGVSYSDYYMGVIWVIMGYYGPQTNKHADSNHAQRVTQRVAALFEA